MVVMRTVTIPENGVLTGHNSFWTKPTLAAEEPEFVQEMNFTDEIVLPCLRQNGTLTAFTNVLRIAISRSGKPTGSDANTTVTTSGGVCTVNLTAESGKRLNVSIPALSGVSCSSNQLVFFDGRRTLKCVLCEAKWWRCSGSRMSVGNHMMLRMVDVTARGFTIVFQALHGGLDVVHLSRTHGYVQTPGFDRGLHYFNDMDTWSTLTPPPGHSTFLSAQKIDLYMYDEAGVYIGGRSEVNKLWKLDAYSKPVSQLLSDQEIHVHFSSNYGWTHPGFLLMFSYHQRKPYRTEVGVWNCSASEWPELYRHFLCDVIVECDGGEDEAPCSYTGRCGQGRLTIENRCYEYVFTNGAEQSWLEASLECRGRGGYLVSLNTMGEFEAVHAVVSRVKQGDSFYIGLRRSPSFYPYMYKFTMSWEDQSMAYYIRNRATFGQNGQCAAVDNDLSSIRSSAELCFKTTECRARIPRTDALCELGALSRDGAGNSVSSSSPPLFLRPHPTSPSLSPSSVILQLPVPQNATFAVPSVRCPAGHATHVFMACDEENACWLRRRRRRHGYDAYVDVNVAGDDSSDEAAQEVSSSSSVFGAESPSSSSSTCPAPMTSLPAMFPCTSGQQGVPYSMVCDHRRQCTDGSDESFCVFPPCSGSTRLRCGTSHQCLAFSAWCNGQTDCPNEEDEEQCGFFMALGLFQFLPPPAIVTFRFGSTSQYSFKNSYDILPLSSSDRGTSGNSSTTCPETYFQCLDNGYCLPVFLRCNGVNDCPGREDEAGCGGDGKGGDGGGSDVSCPGYYRCRSTRICLHPNHVCDGRYQCPQQDDERFCGLECPPGCTCHGLELTCRQPELKNNSEEVRYLDASGSGMSPEQLSGGASTFLLIHLSLSRCGLKSVSNMTFPNLRSLDLSHNQLSEITLDSLSGLLNLQYLSLASNPLKSLFPSKKSDGFSLPAMRTLDISGVKITTLTSRSFAPFTDLHTLNLSDCGIERVMGGFHVMSKLRVLAAVGCPMVLFPRDLLMELGFLRTVEADNFKLCCPLTLPAGFHLANCRAPFDEVSSCSSLLRSNVYVVFLSIFSSLALVGNLFCFLQRILSLKKKNASGFSVLVTNLSISDFLMGVYLAVIGVADHTYRGVYLWEDVSWRHSAACRLAGFISLTSNEVSAFIICLITLDRFLVLRFPFSSLHFGARSAQLTCALVWVVVAAMATAPLTPMASHWSFYSQTGICIPLPVTRGDFAGRHYAFGILIVFNFILFLFIALGQVAIYLSVRANRMSAADSTKKSSDLRIARRLISVAVSDFLCWFPIGLLGLLASRGVPISGEINVGMAILVLPLNSALNPFLYTLNVVLERRKKLHDDQLLKQVMAQLTEK